jgi:hypothetical protein
VAIGPEGGWSAAELGLGAPTIGLGPNVLRAETAAMAAGAVLGLSRAATVFKRCPKTDGRVGDDDRPMTDR